MKKLSLRFVTAFATALLVSCGGDSPDTAHTATDSGSRVVSGVAAKGPITGANIEIYRMDANGVRTTMVASATTNANGIWSVTVPGASQNDTLLVVSRGGDFVDESDTEPDPNLKRRIALGNNDELQGILFPGQNTASITLLTYALIEKSRSEQSGGDFANVLTDNRDLAVNSIGFNPFVVQAANPLLPAPASSQEAVQYAMYLGGMSNALNSVAIALGEPVPNYAIMRAFVKDISDGMLDGLKNGGAAVDVDIDSDGSPDKVMPTNIDLNQAIDRYRNNNWIAYREFQDIPTPQVNEQQLSTTQANLPPSAGSDSGIFTAENASVRTPNVLANDSDPDGDAISIVSFDNSVPGGTVTSNPNGTFDFTPDNGFTGNYVFSYTIADTSGKTDSANVTITVIPGGGGGGGGGLSAPPVADAGADFAVSELSIVNLSAAGSSDDVGIVTYVWAPVSGPAVSLTGATTSTPSFNAPDVAVQEVIQLQLTVTDGDGQSDTDVINVTVNNVVGNLPPVTDAGNDQFVNEGDTVTLAGSATDDDTVASYLWTRLSGPVITFANDTDPATTFTAPNVTGTQVIVLQLTATDNGSLSTSDVVTITVSDLTANTPPNAEAGADQPGALEQTTINLNDAGSNDPDGAIVSYSWTQLSGTNVTINNSNTANADFTSPTVLVGSVDLLVFQLAVTDNGGAIDTDVVSVIVNPVNPLPTADAGTDQTLNELLPVTLDGSGSSDDGSIANYSWNQTAGTLVVLDTTNPAMPTFTGPDVANNETLTFELTVTDNEGGVDTDTVDINLVSLNGAPAVFDDGPLSATEDTPFVFAANSLLVNDTDPEMDSFSFNTYTQPLNGTLTGPTGGNLTYTPNQHFNGTDTFTYTAIDVGGAVSLSATVTIDVASVNDDPVANNDATSTTQGFPVIITGILGNDTDIENHTLFISGVDNPANGIAVNNGDGTITYTPDLLFNGTETFNYFIVDSAGGNATGQIEVTVIADSDGDGIVDTDEPLYGTLPANADTDGDGFYDGHEVAAGTSPLVSLDTPPGTIISAANTNNTIAGNVTWDLAGAPYYVQGGNVTIQNGASLTIEAGVVVKTETNASFVFDVDTGGTLNIMGNAPVPQQVIMTSERDDSINGDTNGDGAVTSPSANNWGGIYFDLNSSGMINNAVIRYTNRSIYAFNASPSIRNLEVGDCSSTCLWHYATSTNTMNVNIDGLRVVDYDGGNGSGNTGIHVESAGTSLVGLNIQNVDIQDVNNGYGMHIESWGGNITGLVDNVTITDPTNTGLYIQSYWTATSSITATFSNINITNPSQRGIWITEANNGAFNNVKFDGVNSVTSFSGSYAAIEIDGATPEFLDTGSMTIDGGEYGLLLSGAADGDYNNIAIDNSITAGISLEEASVPNVFDDVVLNNMTTPFELVGQSLPTVIVTGTTIDASVNTKLLRLSGTMTSNAILGPDPIGAGSVWYLPSDLTIGSGATVTFTDGAIIKMDNNTDIFVNSGGTLLVDAGGGSAAIFTSIHDDAAGGDSNSNGTSTLPAKDDWQNIQPQTGSNVDITNAIIRYGRRAIETDNDEPATFTMTDVSVSNMLWSGIVLDSDAGGVTWTLDNVTVDGANGSNWGVYVSAEGTSTVTLDFNDVTVLNHGASGIDSGMVINASGTATVTGTVSNYTSTNSYAYGLHIDDLSTGVFNPVISGLNITNSITASNLRVEGNSTTMPVFDNSVGPNNLSTSNSTNLWVEGAAGSYSHFNLDNSPDASIRFSNNANPGFWDSATIVLTESPSPLELRGQDLPVNVGTLGEMSANRGYTASTNLVEKYVSVQDTLTADITLVPSPLGVDTSYLVTADVTIPTGQTLLIEDNAVLKMDASRRISVNDGGTLQMDGSAGNEAVITSVNDDDHGGDTKGDGVTAGGAADWNRIRYYDGSNIIIDHGLLRFADYTLVGTSGAEPATFSITNSVFDGHNATPLYLETNAATTTLTIDNVTINGGNLDGILVRAITGAGPVLNFNNITMNNVGNGTSDVALNFYTTGSTTVTGTVTNLTINTPGGRGIYIDDNSTGVFDVVFSNVDISDSVSTSIHIDGDATTQPIFDDSVDPGVAVNDISNSGDFGLRITGALGEYGNIDIDGTTNEALYFENGAAPAVWDTNSITLNNVTEPIGLENMGMPSGVDYTTGTGVTENYVTISGTLVSDTVLGPDPLGVASGDGKPTDPTVSYWYLDNSLYVPTGVTLDVSANTLIKGRSARQLEVQSGGVMNVNGSAGNEVYMTSFSDDAVGDPSSSAATTNNWYGIYFRNGANGGSISSLRTWYGYYGIYHENLATDIVVQDLEIEYALYGLFFQSPVDDTPLFNNVTINETSRNSIYINGPSDTSFNAVFNGTQSITSAVSGGSYDCAYLNTASPSFVFSGWTIQGNCTNGIHLNSHGAVANNIVRNLSGRGIYINTTAAVTVGGNKVLNNNNGGIYIANIANSSVVENNLVRGNTASNGAGLYANTGTLNGIDFTLRNNLIVENHSPFSTGGVQFDQNVIVDMYNNTVADNTAGSDTAVGVGLSVDDQNNAVTYNYNIISNNVNNLGTTENVFDTSTNNTEDYNLEDAASSDGLTGAGSLTGTDPLFTNGWYLTAPASPAINAGDVFPVALGLTGTTTNIDGTLDGLAGGNSDNVDLGYHFTSGVGSVDTTNSTVLPGSAAPAFSETITIMVTPRDGLFADIGAGARVTVSAQNFPAQVGKVRDQGDGTYLFDYTAGTTDQDDTLTIFVNGVQMLTQPFIDW